jgi:uncharacterized OB-fold protein
MGGVQMVTGECRECGKKIFSRAKACPYCGVTRPVASNIGSYGTMVVVLIGAIIVFLRDS